MKGRDVMPVYPLGLDPLEAQSSPLGHPLERALSRVTDVVCVFGSLDRDTEFWRPLKGARVVLLGQGEGVDERWHFVNDAIVTDIHDVDVDVDVRRRSSNLEPHCPPVLTVHPTTIALATRQRCGDCRHPFDLESYYLDGVPALSPKAAYDLIRRCPECRMFTVASPGP